jgi:hypothetical protein
MKSKTKFIILCLVIVFPLTSCVTFKATNLSVLPYNDSMTVIGHFEKTALVSEFFGTSGGANFLNISSDAMSEKVTDIVWKEIRKQGGSGAINVKIEYNATLLDYLANSFTATIWAPAHLKVSGDIIKYSSEKNAEHHTEMSINAAVREFENFADL